MHITDRDLDENDRWTGASPDGKKRLRKIDMWLLDADPGEDLDQRIQKVEDSISKPSTTLAGYVRHLIENHRERQNGSGSYPSENQIGLLYGIADENFDDDAIDRLVKQGWGFESKADIPSREVFEHIGFQLQDAHYASKFGRDPDTKDAFEEETGADDGMSYAEKVDEIGDWLRSEPSENLRAALEQVATKIEDWPDRHKKSARAVALPFAARDRIRELGYEAADSVEQWVRKQGEDLAESDVERAVEALEDEAEALAPSTGEQAAEAMQDGETALEGDETDQPNGTPLPEDFPGKSKLEASGITTVEAAAEQLGELEKIDGIGKVTASHIRNSIDSNGHE